MGALCPGDVAEARLLEEACRAHGVPMSCTVHEGRSHRLAGEMKQSGELCGVLARLVGPPPNDADGESLLPGGFVGFEDCDDF